MLSSGSFGLIPLFSLPLMRDGYSVETTLVYRFAIATLAMWPILVVKKEKLALGLRDACKIALLSCLYLFAVVFFFYAFTYLASGVVATINFLYPLMVMLIMTMFFHERFNWRTGTAAILAIIGVALLSSGPEIGATPFAGTGNSANGIFWGVTLALLAGLCNALYFVGIQVARVASVNGLVMTFYVMVFGAVFCFVNALICDSLQWIGEARQFGLAVLLALVTAVISNLTLIMAIRRIGSTIAAILGVMEPLTAVAVGITVFGEPFGLELGAGMAFVVCAVLLVMVGRIGSQRPGAKAG